MKYFDDLEKKIERRDRLRNELSHAKSSMRNVNIFDRKLPKEYGTFCYCSEK